MAVDVGKSMGVFLGDGEVYLMGGVEIGVKFGIEFMRVFVY